METDVASPRTELLHVGDFDILINHKQTTVSSDELERVRTLLTVNMTENPKIGPLTGWISFPENTDLYANREDNPEYFAKIKWEHIGDPLMDRAMAIRWDASKERVDEKKQMYTGASLMNEMSLAREIREIVESKEVQEIFENVGVESIDYIEPLIGIIDRKTKRKIMIYKFARGRMPSVVKDKNGEELTDALMKLQEVFERHDICADDLEVNQILDERGKDGKKRYHLIDSEFYYRIRR